ncbi:MAG: DUF4919 domain-containing protein [Acetobacteraceae bacterium]|nr:DUF4919 domain-containing protein [Acetobacteraceae bacterium]
MSVRRAFLAALVFTTLAGCATPPRPEPAAVSAANDNGRSYRHMLDDALANPAAADWSALRRAYAASPAYDPFVSVKPDGPNSTAALRRGDWQTAASLAEAAAAENAMDLRAHLNAYVADRQLGRIAAAETHHAVVVGSIRAILGTGDGTTPQTAFHVLATSEEYVLLDTMGLKSQRQALIRQNGHDYDQLTAIHQPDGAPRVVFFNIDVSFAREKAVTLGSVKPIRQNDLPRP